MTAFHVILEGSYEVESPEVNHAFVIGVDSVGNDILSSDIVQADVDLVGERLEVQHTPAATTTNAAIAAVAAILSKARLDGRKGKVTIPPHCGVELWDVINIFDDIANQSASYRVCGYTFEFDAKEGVYLHSLVLCAI